VVKTIFKQNGPRHKNKTLCAIDNRHPYSSFLSL
jgi:hypothetical protein